MNPWEALPGERTMDGGLGSAGELDLLALLPCPLKVPVEEALRAFLARRIAAGKRPFEFCIAGQANHEADLHALAQERDPRRLPALIVSPGLNVLFRQPFFDRFVRGGVFDSLAPRAADVGLAARGLLDPAGRCTVLALNLLVLAVDERALGVRRVPRRLADLLAPEYEDSIAIRGSRGDSFCETLLLSVWRRFGDAGIELLSRATRHGWHPSQMVKAAGSGRPDAPAVSILPLFFAETVRRRSGVRVVWPEDGAVVSPVTLLARADRLEDVRSLLGFLRGIEVARICSGAAFPALHAGVPPPPRAEAPLDWLGWDFVDAHEIGALVERLNGVFVRARARMP